MTCVLFSVAVGWAGGWGFYLLVFVKRGEKNKQP